MSKLKKLPELLAPAGSEEALKAAIAAGADAVYLSGKRFGARKYASNFDETSLARAIDYAHLRGVRVYVTVNTLVRENELADVARYLVQLYQMGCDAVLVQDIGVALLAKNLVPKLQRHASTQMTIHCPQGVLWAEKAGFQRVVLAREVSLDAIRDMKPKSGKIGLEVFVHGALCYSYSGQCLLSSAIGGRSGNRGMCAQPCRKPYVLLKGEMDQYGRPVGLSAQPLREKYLISTRDLCTYKSLDRIVRSSISSLKIEGRMKSAEYVAIVTHIYRKALDAIARGKWSPTAEDERELMLAFNRSFTGGHLLGAGDVMGREASDNRGVLIGSVAFFDAQRGEAAIRLSEGITPAKGDGLVFQAPGQEVGLVVQKVMQKDGLLRLLTPERIKPGARVFLTGSTALGKKAGQIIASARTEISMELKLFWHDDRPVLQARLQDGLVVELQASFKMEKAKNQPLTRQQIEAQMRRTGSTPFVIKEIEMDYAEDLFAPLGALNKLRRDLLEKVEQTLLENRRPGRADVERAEEALKEMKLSDGDALAASISMAPLSPQPRRNRPELSVYADSLEAVKGAVDGGCSRVYFEPRLAADGDGGHADRASRAIKLLNEAKAICKERPLIWKWPRIASQDFFLLAQSLASAWPKLDGIMVENVGAIEAFTEMQSTLPEGISLYGGMGLNVCNHLTVQALSKSLQMLTLSPELSARQLALIVAAMRPHTNQPALELVVQGSLEVMVAEDCVPCLVRGNHTKEKTSSSTRTEPSNEEFWGLQDMRRIFPLRLDDEKRTHIFNSAETCLLDMMPEIFAIGLDGVAVDARGRTGIYARQMTAIYKRAMDLVKEGGENLRQDLQAQNESIACMSLGGVTHGHFVKGLRDEID